MYREIRARNTKLTSGADSRLRRLAIVAPLGLLLISAMSGCRDESKISFTDLAKFVEDDNGNVTTIVLRYKHLEHDSLEGMAEKHGNVVRLTIQDCKGVTDAMLTEVAKLKNLEELELLDVAITDRGLSHLAGHPKLRRLQLADTKVTGTGLSHLAKTLVSLELRGDAVTTEGARTIGELTNLEKLFLHCSKITVADLDNFEDLGKLREWESFFTPNGKGAGAAVAQIPNLESLYLSGKGMVDSDVAEISKMNFLLVLKLSQGEITDAGLAHVGELVGLERLYLGGCVGISDDGLAHLSPLTSLTYLDLMDSGVTGSGLLHLLPLASLELVELTAQQFTHTHSIIQELNKVLPDCEVSIVQG